ncbi:hypothetical protein NIES4106_53360 [Fischerella sp. NIES-4106]|nr:hypothetical protein NIES4106_53360 [Fischerella sp. NIES-4106]
MAIAILHQIKQTGQNLKHPAKSSLNQQEELEEVQTALDCLLELGLRNDEKSAKNKGYWKFTLTLKH